MACLLRYNDTLVSISSTFYVRIFCTKVLCAAFFYLHATTEKLPKRYEKGVRKTLMKLTAGCNLKKDYSETALLQIQLNCSIAMT